MDYFITESPIQNIGQFQDLVYFSQYSIHMHMDWLASYAELLLQRNCSFFLTVNDKSGKIFGALLLEKINVRGTRFFNLIKLVPFTSGPSDFFDILCLPGLEEEVSEALSTWLRKHNNSWDSLKLDLIPESTNVWKPFVKSLEYIGYHPETSNDRFFFKINTEDHWEDYKKQLHQHTHDLRNRLNRVEKDGISLNVEYVKSNILHYWDGFIQCYRERRSLREQNNSFELLEGMGNFIQAMIVKFEPMRMVQLSLLYGNDDIWAYQLDWIYNGIWYHYMPTFDQRFERYSPGKILLYKTIQEAFARPEVHEFNFMRGQSAYKSQFAWDTEKYICIKVENHKSIRNKALRVASKITNFRDRFFDR